MKTDSGLRLEADPVSGASATEAAEVEGVVLTPQLALRRGHA